jgi:hypothetical protein
VSQPHGPPQSVTWKDLPSDLFFSYLDVFSQVVPENHSLKYEIIIGFQVIMVINMESNIF